MAALRRPQHWKTWLIGGVIALVVLALGVPFAYIHLFTSKAPAALTLSTAAPSPGSSATGGGTTPATGSVAGAWTVARGSEAGYRVSEVLVGQKTTAVGRTSSVTGSLTISGTTLSAATVNVDLRTVASDKSQRDAQFQGRIMDTAAYPTATFTLTKPVDLAPLPAVGA
ncbi:polyisoprenoid-binding protein YceI [Streptacidiphilus sp. EB129]